VVCTDISKEHTATIFGYVKWVKWMLKWCRRRKCVSYTETLNSNWLKTVLAPLPALYSCDWPNSLKLYYITYSFIITSLQQPLWRSMHHILPKHQKVWSLHGAETRKMIIIWTAYRMSWNRSMYVACLLDFVTNE
jgi:hypothetical protein